MTRSAVVVGGGIAGLATAAALHACGWSVRVHERRDALAPGGTALGMWPEAMRVLDRLGAAEPVRRRAAFSRGAAILDPRGAVIGRIPDSRAAYLISRERLLTSLLERLPEDAVLWGQRWNPTDALSEADLVVGADGVHSAIRARHWGVGVERPLGTVAFRGVLERPVVSVSETWGAGMLFGITPMDDGRTNWFACLRRSRVESGPGGRADGAGDSGRSADLLRDAFATWHPGVQRVLDQLDGAEIDRRTLVDVSLAQRYAKDRVVLLGDAAHGMAPNLGRGACESLVDAVALADALEAHTAIDDALRRYDRLRRRRTRRIVSAARILNRVATAERGAALRDVAVRVLLARADRTG
ncbi:FAD-dependent monooxygenase [Microbacterium sp.]|uniref:FAD-dependent monooxygenase n=1 Tax=Microbacterium sp. TaxID=51671 RepID=UPI00281141F6|nr:FAD-dependent monooxygenase [Microbacterium sp.]